MKATNIEQSKHLMELGLNPQSADMNYDEFGVLRLAKPQERFQEYRQIPCWSLEILLELMPDFEFWTTSDKKYSITSGWYQSDEFDNVFDAVYDLMVMLLENKCIYD